MPNIRWLLALVTAVHRFVYRASGGRLGARLNGVDTLLLANVGRKSGTLRHTPLLYVRDGERYVVVASNAGDDRHPAWWLNLKAHPETSAQVGRRHVPVHARRAGPEETARLWTLLEAAYPPYAEYRTRTSREIPIVVLEPRTPGASAA